MSRQSAAARVSDAGERPSLYVVGSEHQPLPTDVLATLRIVAEIMLAKRRREERERTAKRDIDVVESVTNTEGHARSNGRGPSLNPE